MPSTFTSDLRLELQATGENSATWGTKLNTGIDLTEDAISGMTTVSTTGGNYTLSVANAAADEARRAILKITGTLVSNSTIIIPAVTKKYTVWNATSGAFTVTVKTSGGTGAVVDQGFIAGVFCDGTDTRADDALKAKLASTASGEGTALLGYSTAAITAKAALDERLPEIGTYALLRAYSGSYTSYFVRGVASLFDGGHGIYRVNASDTTSADNGGTIIVDASSRRWYREFSGAMDVRWFGASGDGSDETADVQAALNAIAPGGTLLITKFISCASGLSLTGKAGITIESVSQNAATPNAGLRYTGAGSGTFLAFTSCSNIHLNCHIEYNNGGFTGTLVSLPNTARVSLRDMTLYGNGVTSALYLLDMDTSIEVDCRRVRFSGAQYLVRGQHQSGAGYANAVHLGNCDFDRYTVAAIRNPGQGWEVNDGCAFENRVDTTGKAITMDAGVVAMGLRFSGNWLGDASSNTGWSWIDIAGGTGIEIEANYINGTGGLTAKGIDITGAVSGLVVKANRFSSLAAGVDLGSSLVTDSEIGPNAYATVTNKTSGTPGTGVTSSDRGWYAFPATQVANADPNTLDDYEEGDWTPDLRFGGVATGITYSARNGRYTKIGRCVYFTFDFTLTSKGSAVGGASISGLPFTSRPEIGVAWEVGFYANITAAMTFMNRVEDSNTILSFGKPTGTTVQGVPETDFTDTTRIAGSGFYFT